MQWQFYTTSEQTWAAMQEALRSAKESIYLESYIFLDDEIGREFVDILVEKAQQGLDVRLILDGIGSFWFSVAALKRLEAAGARVLSFQSLALRRVFKSVRRLFHRNHRKTLIIDRSIGFIGGVNVDNVTATWLDLHVKIEGVQEVEPMVHSFAKTWVIGGGKRRHVRSLFHLPLVRVRKKIRHIAYVFAHPYVRFKQRSRVRQLYMEALQNARERITIATPYFIPDKKLLDAFAKARRRNVQIDLLVPLFTDLRLVTFAMHDVFVRAHAMGVNLFLLPKMMHGKALVMDARWGTIGSSNIDSRSFFYNHEANITFTNREMVRDLLQIFDGWKRIARPFDAVRWGRRSWYRKVLEWVMGCISPIL